MIHPRGGSIILIGMPGSGKSTVGVLLAKELVKNFVDTDLLIQEREGRSLQDIINNADFETLRGIEEEVLLAMDCRNHIIATGGSVIYSEAAMNHLKQCGRTVFLDVPLEELTGRVQNYATRGIAAPPGQGLAELFAERRELYERYGDTIVECGKQSPDQIVAEIIYRECEGYAELDA